MHWLFIFILSLSVVALLMPIFIQIMEKYRLLDQSGGRKIHKGYTAHMGGILIFIGFLSGFIFSLFGIHYQISRAFITSLIVLFALITIMGVRDDMNSLSPLLKLIFEIAIGILICALDVRLFSFYGFLGIYELPIWLSYVLTIFFFVVVSNSFNLIDGIDGQAAMQAVSVLGFICIFLMRMLNGSSNCEISLLNPLFWVMLIAAMLGAIVGFLMYNWQPAKVFMGDTGSLLIGYMIAIAIVVAMNLNGKYGSQIFGIKVESNLAVILSLFFLPLADTLRVFILRVKKGKSPLYPDKTHIHHLLLRAGHSHQSCTIITFSIQVIISLVIIALALVFNDNLLTPIVILLWVLYVIVVKRYSTKILSSLCNKK
jgi:UDP-N-acetylmuramyl pentapeptide phosphotransferase/UDP-N-acetylglucosamine-1-phosphate transferase